MMRFFLLPLLLVGMSSLGRAEPSEGSRPIIAITIDSEIAPYVADYIEESVKRAEVQKAAMLLIYLDTPGGLLDATRKIVQTFLLSSVPICVYVHPDGARAGSAGVFITLAAHIAAMSPSSNIGAATPVTMGGGDVEGDMKKKIENDAAAWARSIAETRHRNAAWAEEAVRGAASVTAQEALKLNVIDVIARDTHELLKSIEGKTVTIHGQDLSLHVVASPVVDFPLPWRLAIMKFLSNPNLIYILMLLGILGIVIELQTPGLILPGMFGGLCLVVVFAVQVLPINWFGALLIFAAAGFFIAEIFIVSFGVLAIAGTALLIAGSYLLFDVSGSTFFVEPLLIWLFSIGLASLLLVLGFVVWRAKSKGSPANVFALVGQTAMVKEAITQEKPGKIMLAGAYWNAVSRDACAPGDTVKVESIEGTKVMVTKIHGDRK